MPEKSTTPDPEEALRRMIEALNRRDFDAAVSLFAPDGVWDFPPLGFAVLEEGPLMGHHAMRKSLEDLTESFQDFEFEIEDFHDLGSGGSFNVFVQRGRPHGSDRFVESRLGVVAIWRDGRVARATSYQDVDQARAAAKRLALERGDFYEPVTLDPVEQTRQQWEATSRGEFDPQGLADNYVSDAVLDTAGYGMGTFEGRDAIRGFLADWAGSFDDLTAEAEEILSFGNGVVLTVYRQKGRPLGASDYVRVRSAMVTEFVDGKIARNTIYTEAEIDQARGAAERLAKDRR
jgi:ketosteroid isomerase-like protein